MSPFSHPLIGLGSTALVIASLLAGCGRVSTPAGAPLTPGLKRPVAEQPARTAPGTRNREAPVAPADDDADLGDDGDAPAEPPAPPAAGGGLRPLPKVTPTPPPAAPGAAPEPSEVDRFHRLLRNYGYRGTPAQMMGSIRAITHQYPTRWDPQVNTLQHWEWWRKTLDGSTNGDVVADNPNDYVQQAVDLARYRFDVEYYVWVSKQSPNQLKNGAVPPLFNFNEELPIVKSIAGEGLIVQISERGTVLDYLQMPMHYKRDLNHLIAIPPRLY